MEQFGVLTLGSRLKRLSDFLFAEVQVIYEACDVPISSTYFPILSLLQVTRAMSVVELADSLKVSHPAISKQVSKMLQESLLIKVADPQDQRRTRLALSESGRAAMKCVQPVLKEMAVVLEQATQMPSSHFMAALLRLEQDLFDGGLAQKVLDRLRKVEVVDFQSHHRQAFHDLNMAWLMGFFPEQINAYDKALLADPEEHILQRGGHIFCALGRHGKDEKVLGTVAILPNDDGASISMLKLAVAEHCQGKGIAQQLIDCVVEYGKRQGVTCISLETASNLQAANALYVKNGFITKPAPKPSCYSRADRYMEKSL
ncbi:MarR family transcriptional regulator with acetyltransferase activity [Marinomonas pollencensis]|uniref:MarR family transcriptional regulator with acetyltransferase activity n=2 Tax=Marinomonas pollencensis TaxID=491954 RepID=A0A3E0DUK8_9GAMM|nr:MarR family transcriptional regulator with acetyltransferase activity [Marinomonas pollencensis]